MIVDLVVLILLALFVLHGLYRGLLVQVFSLIALAGVVLLSPYLGRAFQRALLGITSFAPTFCMVLGTFIAGLILYILIRIGLNLGFHHLGREEETHRLRPWNKVAGGILGGVKGGVLLWLFFCLIFTFPLEVERMPGGGALRRSRFGQVVTKWNPVARTRAAQVLTGLMEVLDDPVGREALIRDVAVQDFLARLQKKTGAEGSLLEQARSGGFSKFLGQMDVRKIVRDEELYRLFAEVDWAGSIERAQLAAKEARARER